MYRRGQFWTKYCTVLFVNRGYVVGNRKGYPGADGSSGVEWHQASDLGPPSGPSGVVFGSRSFLYSRIATTMSIKLPKIKITAMIWPKPQASSPGWMFVLLRWTWSLCQYAFLYFDNRDTAHDQLECRNTIHRVSDGEMLRISYYEDLVQGTYTKERDTLTIFPS